jgi:hypothetical protein
MVYETPHPAQQEADIIHNEAPNNTLSPISEEPSEVSRETPDSLFIQEDPELRQALEAALAFEDFSEPCEDIVDPPGCDYDDHMYDESWGGSTSSSAPVEFYHVVAANFRADLPWDYNLQSDPDYVEVYYTGDTWKLLPDVDHLWESPPKAGDTVVLRIATNNKSSGTDQARRAVVQRDDDILTKDEEFKHKVEVEAAMLQELKTWAKFECFSRKLRKQARNIIDCRWVLKWKWEYGTVSAIESDTKQTARRVIRARLTVRGFKDVEKHLVDRYAGTSQRYSQRILASEAILRGWRIATTDISKAFLQGVTYKELSELTGAPIREVNFYLPATNVHLLQQVEGYSNFNPSIEVLHCDKPGTGSVDAPRCFSMKLSICTTQRCGMESSSVDPELCMLHYQGGLVCLMTKHVDDLKLTGEEKWILWVLHQIQEVFGDLKIIWDDFTNCGVHHVYDKVQRSLTLDQIDYAKNLRTISHPELTSTPTEADCGPELHQLYMSLLGAVAYLYLTRMDILVFICGCQRWSHKPKIIHVKRLNVIVRWAQRNPRKLVYRVLRGIGTHLRIVSDAAFKKEEEKGHSIRGSIYLRAQGSSPESFHADGPVHILEYMCKALRHVTRSTFSAELHASCDSADLGILVNLMLHEITSGPVTSSKAREMRDSGGYAIPMTLQIDAMSVFAAITATYIKHPAEKGLLSHVQFIRELLDTGVLRALIWIDTRDMASDGLTKGSVERTALHELMNGIHIFKHEFKLWKSNLTKTTDTMVKEAKL